MDSCAICHVVAAGWGTCVRGKMRYAVKRKNMVIRDGGCRKRVLRRGGETTNLGNGGAEVGLKGQIVDNKSNDEY